MSSSIPSPKAPRVRQVRKSIAHTPSAYLNGNEENTRLDGGTSASLSAQGKQVAKKNRSKSIGPGGLDALKEGSGNKQQVRLPREDFENSRANPSQPAIPPYVKSILKPTITLSPPKAIPPHSRVRNNSPGKANVRQTPEKSPRKSPTKKQAEDAAQGLPNPFQTSPMLKFSNSRSPARSPTRIAVRSEEEQQAAAKERERQEKLASRDARRKSLGKYVLIWIENEADMTVSESKSVFRTRSYFAYMECC